MEPDRYLAGLRPLFEGRRVVCIGATVRSLTVTARHARSLGASDVMVIGMQGDGNGDALDPNEAVVSNACIDFSSLFGDREPTAMDVIRAEESFIRTPPSSLLRDLAEFDPERTALVLGQFVNTQPLLDGRAFLAHRKPAWLALEDKTVIDEFFDRAGVVRSDSEVVLVDQVALQAASNLLDRGDGVVWSGDAREGFNGGAEYVFWVRDAETFSDAFSFLSAHCDRLRVMPFLEGIPCSIHGIVLPDGVAALRPVEMMTLRRNAPGAPGAPGTPRASGDSGPSFASNGELHRSVFTYRGCASFYEPSWAVRSSMAEMARRVGERLRAEVGFAGCFTLDGVVTNEGFRPTEVNPRQGAGIPAMLGGLRSVPVGLLMDAWASGLHLGLTAAEVEADFVAAADANPGGGTWSMINSVVAEHDEAPLAFVDGAFRLAIDAEPVAALLTCGTRESGSFVRAKFQHPVVPSGPSAAPLAVALWAFVDAELGGSVGPMSPAAPT